MANLPKRWFEEHYLHPRNARGLPNLQVELALLRVGRTILSLPESVAGFLKWHPENTKARPAILGQGASHG
jgi:hypothetical protein